MSNPCPIRVLTITRLLSAAFLIQILLCMSLWTMQSRSFIAIPLLPVGIGQGAVRLLSPVLTALLAAGLLARVLRPQLQWLRWAVVAVLAAHILLDVHRLQVWVWFYLLWYVCFEPLGWRGFTLLAGSMYLWSGLNKINLHFLRDVVPDWLAAFGVESTGMTAAVAVLAVVLEVGIGAALLLGSPTPTPDASGQALRHMEGDGYVKATDFRSSFFVFLDSIQVFRVSGKFLRVAVWCLHGFILLVLALKQGWNVVVWPWNIVLPVLLGTHLFASEPPKARSSFHFSTFTRNQTLPFGGLVLAGFAPFMHLFGLWPYTLSWMMYSGLQPELTLAVKAEAFGKSAPVAVVEKAFTIDGETFIVLDDWTFREAQVPPFAARWVFDRHAEHWCDHAFGANPYSYQLTAARFCAECEQFERSDCATKAEPSGARDVGVVE